MSTRQFRNLESLVAACLALLCVGVVCADVLPLGLKIERVLDGSQELGDLVQSPTGELWLLERNTGVIRVLAAGVERAVLAVPVTSDCESGLLDVAFAADHARTGLAFVYYVDPGSRARVDEVRHRGRNLELGDMLVDLGTTPGGCRPGGGLAVGPDGKLYVAVGDLGNPSHGQNHTVLAGKVLRANLDGSVPADNLSGTLRFADGFRNGKDLAIDPSGNVYVADVGEEGLVHDEINLVLEGGNYGWAIVDGIAATPPFDDPIVAYLPPVGLEGLETIDNTALGTDLAGSLVGAYLAMPELAAIDPVTATTHTLYDPWGDRDGTPDPGCPRELNALMEGGEGWLYGSASWDNPGIWRVWNDRPGPREVSAPGSPFYLTVDKKDADLEIGWERLGTLDAGRPARHGGQHPTTYQVWEGWLPIHGLYTHVPVLATDGTPQGPARLTTTVIPGEGDRYYLISAQGDNKEGPLGGQRPTGDDYCYYIGWGITQGLCAQDWVDPRSGHFDHRLVDYNSDSPTYLQEVAMSDFRGNVIRLDLATIDCFLCYQQAPFLETMDAIFRDRDLRIVTVMTQSYVGLTPIPPAACASQIATFASSFDPPLESPVLCDTDLDGDNRGDVSGQYFDSTCGGIPQNYYVDQGHVIFRYVCGAELSLDPMLTACLPEINPETCE